MEKRKRERLGIKRQAETRNNDEEDSTTPRDKIATSSWKTRKKRKQMKTGENKEVKSVIFVPHTVNSELAQPKIR